MKSLFQSAIRIVFTRSDKINCQHSFLRDFHIAAVMPKNKIPDRWEEYQAIGKIIKGTRFISFKVPLNESLSRHLPSTADWFTPANLPDAVREQNLELGLVIDLTNTTRYYNPQELIDNGIEYKKIFTEGHAIPSKAVQESFSETVDNFLKSNKDNGRVIGVHCTHGLNRTGYLICRYMIDQMKFNADTAINAFNTARGHAMERENYLNDLNGLPNTELEIGDEREDQSRRKRPAPCNVYEDSGAPPIRSRCVGQRTNANNNCNYYANPQSSYDRTVFYGDPDYRNASSHQNRYENGPHSSRYSPWNPRQGRQNHDLQTPEYTNRSHRFASYTEAVPYDYNYQPHSNFNSFGRPNWSYRSAEQSDYGQFGRINYREDNEAYKGRHHPRSQH